MNKYILVDVKRFDFLDTFLKSPYMKISAKEFSKAVYAFVAFAVVAVIYLCMYLFGNNFNAFSTLNIICYIFGAYSLFYCIYSFHSYYKTKNYSFFEVYTLLVHSHDSNPRFVLFEYMSAMRTVANLIISNKSLNNEFYSEIDKIEAVLNLFNPIIGVGYEIEFDMEAEIYIKNGLLEDMNKTLPIIARMEKYLIGDDGDENVFTEFLKGVVSGD